MPIEILMPALSPTMKEGNLAKWIKQEGDNIAPGDVIAEIETDKATMEVEAVEEGVLAKLLVAEGTENVPVNQAIALLLEEGEDKLILKGYKVKSANLAKKEDKISKKDTTKESPVLEKKLEPKIEKPAINNIINQVVDSTIITKNKDYNSDIKASPVAKNIAVQNNINLAQISGTGPKGRVIKQDVLDFIEKPQSTDCIVRVAQEYEAIPNSNIRKVIASRLVEAKQTIPHFYLNIECQIANLLEARKQVNSLAAKDEHGKSSYKISVNDFIIKASAMALKQVPEANASWHEDAILQYNNIDVAVAVAIADGLITPIIRNAEQKKILAISKEMKQLVAKAKSGSLTPEEFQGGGFSISNLGMYGIKQFNAIVNPPQGAIIAIGAGEKKVIVNEQGNFVAIDIINVSLSCDHRVIDGAVAAQYLNKFKYYIENPVTLLM
jgi:pyruvate dehydrogenase E2 component (dihydrolipoamide acetyltransferase)